MNLIMKKILNILICLPLIFAVYCLSSCEDEILEQTNPNALTDGNFWITNTDFDMATNSMYGALQLPHVRGGETSWYMLRSDFGGTEAWYYRGYCNFKYTDSDNHSTGTWSEYYIGVFRANQILHYLNESNELTDAQKLNYEAQARCMRGIEYFWLGKDFNQAIIRSSLPTVAEMDEELSSQKDVYDFAIEELKFAQKNLPKTWPDSDKGRFTWGVATATLGKVYLFEKDYTNAAKCFKAIIDSKLYTLVPNYIDNFTSANEFNSESIFEIAFSDNYKEGANGNNHDETNGSECNTWPSALATLAAGGYNTALPSYWLIGMLQFADEIDPENTINEGFTHSQRSYATIVTKDSDGDYYQSPLITETLPDGTVNKTKTPFTNGQAAYIRKWTDWMSKDKEDTSTGRRSGVNWREIRYADVLLMYAECLLNQDNVTDAITYIDQVRKRAGVYTLQHYMDVNGGKIPKLDVSLYMNDLDTYPLVDATAENVLHHLQMVERPTELAFEGHRWDDLVRWGIVDQVFQERREEEKKLCKKLTGDENLASPTTGEDVPPFYLGKIRMDFLVKLANYIPSEHNYLPIPSLEKQLNNTLSNNNNEEE